MKPVLAGTIGFLTALALCICAAVLWGDRLCGKRMDEVAKERRGQTPLAVAFDPEMSRQQYGKRFKRISNESSGAGMRFPNGEMFRVFQIQGKIGDDDMKRLLADIQEEFAALAKSAGIAAAEPKGSISDRPIQLVSAFCDEIYARSVQGFYITYDGGAIDVFADKRGKNEKDEWRITCMLHEKE